MKKAFTLIELLIVIAIIAILAAILFVSIGQQPIQKSRDAKRVSDMQAMRTALALFYTDNDRYPTFTEASSGTTFLTKYIPVAPTDPLNGQASASGCSDARYTPSTKGYPANTSADTNYAYTYQQLSSGQAYLLQTCLELSTNKSLDADCDDTTQGCAPTGNNIDDIHS